MLATFDVCSPYDGHRIETLADTSEAEAFAALERAHARFCDRAGWLPPYTRAEILRALAARVSADAEPLARQIALEGGKPLKDARVEIRRAIEGVHLAIAEIPRLTGVEIPMNQSPASAQRFAHTWREPRGAVLAISAFNHPFNLLIHQAITALAAGCPVVLKPSRATPLSARSLVAHLTAAGLPAGWCELIWPSDPIAERLVSDPRVACLSFIGSAKVGWHLRRVLAPGATCILEHGGAAPVILDASADLAAAIAPLTRGACYHAGQVCVSVQRVYAHRACLDALLPALTAAFEALRTGDPSDPATDVGPLIRPAEVDRVHRWVSEAIEGGAKLLCGGRPLGPTLYAPTLLLDPPADAKVMTHEIFGPVLTITPVADLDEAIERANTPAHHYFQAAIFTRDLDHALGAARRLNATAVMINDHTAFRVDWMPFGGHRHSGLGQGGIGPTMRDLTLERLAVFHSPAL